MFNQGIFFMSQFLPHYGEFLWFCVYLRKGYLLILNDQKMRIYYQIYELKLSL